MLADWRPDFLVVDECHCLWDWGDGFRPAFGLLPPLIRDFGIARSLWLTATHPPAARNDLRERLPLNLAEIGGFELPLGLHLSVLRVPWPERAPALERWLHMRREPGIIFVATREATLKVSRIATAQGRKAVPYHAGLSQEERRAVEARLRDGGVEIVVATSAFGMGMDYPELHWALLWQAPLSLLSLAQAIGRVGRGNQEGRAMIFWDPEDFRLIEWAALQSPRRKRELAEMLEFLRQQKCRRAALDDYFRVGLPDLSKIIEKCGKCDFCTSR